MNISPFALERYFARHEFSARYLLSSSDCESLSMRELIGMADHETSGLWDTLRLGYTESPGHPLLREEISALYQGFGPGEVLVMVPEEAIFLTMHALLNSGDHVVCMVPAYQSLHEVARSIGCRVSGWEPVEERGWRFDLSDLERLLEPDTRLVVVNFPHNPTGALLPRDEYESVLRLAAERGVYLLSDEMYRYLEIEEGERLPAGCELYERAISLSGLSKSYGLPGLRVGWLASRDREVLDRITVLKDYTTICNSAPAEILALIALRNREAITGLQLARARRNLAVLDKFFARHKTTFQWNRPRGGSICFPRMLAVDDTAAFCDELVRETGIMLVPSKMFEYGNRHVRVGFGREDLPGVIALFEEYLEARFR